ncbi:hypothetical protein GF325_16925 [Candidatus Bathyarchaeota archaeon]|nr:hypothetical protein [Candidatus Bathyarchaeota archaeon]
MGKISRALKYLLKMAFYHNPVDAYISWHRKRLEKRGNTYEYDQMIYWRIGYIFFPRILKITNKFTWSGVENLELGSKTGSFMIISNHRNALDPFYAGTAISCGTMQKNYHVSWVSKLANLKTPLMKSIISYFGTIPLDGSRHLNHETYEKMEQVLEKGQCIGFFPEGGRNKDGSVSDFHAGAARLCLEYKIPYIPIALTGVRKFFKGKCHCYIGRPVYLDPGLECSYKLAKEISKDMKKQVIALHQGKDVIPPSRFELSKDEFKERLNEYRVNGPERISYLDRAGKASLSPESTALPKKTYFFEPSAGKLVNEDILDSREKETRNPVDISPITRRLNEKE